MTGIRIICIGGSISDIGWLASHGVDEAGIATQDTSMIPNPAFIHDAGITYATWNPFNDPGYGPGTDGDLFGGAICAAKNAGWDLIAGAGCGGDIVRVVNNYMWYCNLAGSGGQDYDGLENGQINAYVDPWNYPTNERHVDYIRTYVDGCSPSPNSTIMQMSSAYSAGAQEVGICIVMFDCMNLGVNWYIDLIDKARAYGLLCDNVLFWCDVGYDICSFVKGDFSGTFQGLIDRYGVRKGMRGT